MKHFTKTHLIVLIFIALGMLPQLVDAKPIDCKNANSMEDCAAVCEDVFPPEMDYGGGPYAPFVKRYNDCLKQAFKTFRLPRYWFSDYKQTDRYSSMFMSHLLNPTVAQKKFSSCEGKDVSMPVVMERWEKGMITRYVAITNKNWVYLEIDKTGSPGHSWINLGTVSGNQTRFYRNVIMDDSQIYISPMNNSERPKLETAVLKKGLVFGLYSEDGDDSLDYLLPVPSDTNNVMSPFGLVLWSGFGKEGTSLGDSPYSIGEDPFSFDFYRPNEIQFLPSHRSMYLGTISRYAYNDKGLPKEVSTYRMDFDQGTHSFDEADTVKLSFDAKGRATVFSKDCDNNKTCSISFVYEGDNYCPAQINNDKGETIYQFEYNRDGRLIRRYPLNRPGHEEDQIRLYYKNDMDYTWNINNLNFSYDKPLKAKPDSSKFEPEGQAMYKETLVDPNDKHNLEDHFARPFLMDLELVTQGEFEKRMGRNPSGDKMEGGKTKCESPSDHSIEPEKIDLSSQKPVVSVTWFDALAYANARSNAEGLEECYKLDKCEFNEGWYVCGNVKFKGLDCKGYRLPTWAEARVTTDTTSKSSKYEWVWDWFGPTDKYCFGECHGNYDNESFINKNQYNSLGPTTGVCRRVTGKSTFPQYNPIQCYPPTRGGSLLGFRLVRTVM